MGEKAIGWTASLAAGLTFLVAVLLGVSLLNHPEQVIVPLVDWISIGELQVQWAFQVDTLSVTMMLVVAGVGSLIHIYSIGYMHEDVRFNGDPGRFRRFFVYLNLFIAAMMILVSADSYLMLFVGWEGVGLCSYLLIGFWFEKGKDGTGNAMAAKKAFVTNRVGDFGLINRHVHHVLGIRFLELRPGFRPILTGSGDDYPGDYFADAGRCGG